MIDWILGWFKGLKPVHYWLGGGAGLGAVLHVLFWARVKDAVGGFFSSLGEAVFGRFKEFLDRFKGKKPRRISGYQLGRLVQKVKDMDVTLKRQDREIKACRREKSSCLTKTMRQDEKIKNLDEICTNLTRQLLALQKKAS